MKRKPIDVEELKKVFRINKYGKLERLYYGKWKEISVVSNHNHGYCRVHFIDRALWYHVVLWILYTGKDVPSNMVIDHINGNRLDNRIENLRMIIQRENAQNNSKHRSGKLCGCYFNKREGRYRTQIQIGNKRIHLGYYNTEEEAHNIYVNASRHIEEYIDNASFRELVNKDQK